jgi:soluble lytic murein transglycosylase-like protein
MSYRATMIMRASLWLIVAVMAWASVVVAWAQIPKDAARHRREVIKNSRLVWGLDAPTAVFGAQLQQESSFQEGVVSPAGAQGMAQFLPSTAIWLAALYPELGLAQPLNPAWAIRAMVTYDKHLYDRISAADKCNLTAKMLVSYNGGNARMEREEILAAQAGLDWLLWFDNVEKFNAGRSAGNWAENRHYPRVILLTLAPRYVKAGWGTTPCP